MAPDASTDKSSLDHSQAVLATKPAGLETAVRNLQTNAGDADVKTDEERPVTVRQRKKKSTHKDRPAEYPAPDEPDEIRVSPDRRQPAINDDRQWNRQRLTKPASKSRPVRLNRLVSEYGNGWRCR